MPEQNPLPFPDGQGPDGSRPPEGGTPPPPTAGAAPDQATPPLPIPVSAPNGRPGKTPLWAQLMHKLIDPWVNLDIEPEAPGALIDSRPVCYVLEDYGLSNALILDRACQLAGLPSPLLPLPGDPIRRKRAYLALSRRNAGTLIPEAGASKTHSDSLARLLQAHRHNPHLDVQLVPVSIFVGRAPDKASGWFAVLFSETGRWWAASAGCWRSCSTAAARSCGSHRRSRSAIRSTKHCRPSARCASSRGCCAPTSTASANR